MAWLLRVVKTRRLALLTRIGQTGQGYVAIVRNPRFFPLWLSQLVSNLGDTFNYIALVIVVFRMTHSGLALAVVSICQIVPVIGVSLLAGILIDRFNRKWILVSADLVRGGAVVLLIAADQTNQIGLVYLAAVLLAVAGSFFRPALQAVIPALLSEEELLAANAVAWSTEQLVQIVGAALAGGLIVLVGPSSAFALNALSFFVSAALLGRLTVPVTREEPMRDQATPAPLLAGLATDLREGLRFARHTPLVRRMLVVQMLASLAAGGTSALLVVLSARQFGLPPAGFSLLLAAIGVGALVGPFLLSALTREVRDLRLVFGPYLIRGAGDMLLAVVTPVPIALLLLGVYGLSTSTGMVTYNAFMQASVPERMRGRVYTLFDLTWSVLEITSLGVAGWLNDQVGVQLVYVLGGALLLSAGVLGLLWVPQSRSGAPRHAGAPRPSETID